MRGRHAAERLDLVARVARGLRYSHSLRIAVRSGLHDLLSLIVAHGHHILGVDSLLTTDHATVRSKRVQHLAEGFVQAGSGLRQRVISG